jgi:hypothetical protein
MRIVSAAICLMLAAAPAVAGPSSSAPAPLLGVGVPAIILVGGILLVARRFRKP